MCDLAHKEKAEWAVVDGYQFDSAYQSAVRDAGLKLLLIDDHGAAPPYSADLVLNQNVHAKEDLYRERGPCRRPISADSCCGVSLHSGGNEHLRLLRERAGFW